MGKPEAGGVVRLSQSVAGTLGEIVEQQADGFALRLHDAAVPDALVGVPAHPARADEQFFAENDAAAPTSQVKS